MARPRLPAAKAEVSGAALVNAGRFKDRKAPNRTRPLGEPYAKMSDPERVAWEEFRAELPWLNGSHRALLRIACILQVRMDAPDVGVNQIQTFSAILSKLAATPVDETKVGAPDDEDDDPEDRFFNRPGDRLRPGRGRGQGRRRAARPQRLPPPS
jgi:hypothetical protein